MLEVDWNSASISELLEEAVRVDRSIREPADGGGFGVIAADEVEQQCVAEKIRNPQALVVLKYSIVDDPKPGDPLGQIRPRLLVDAERFLDVDRFVAFNIRSVQLTVESRENFLLGRCESLRYRNLDTPRSEPGERFGAGGRLRACLDLIDGWRSELGCRVRSKETPFRGFVANSVINAGQVT